MDDREQNSGVDCALQAMPGVSLSIRRLAVGDYQANGHLLFERKSLADFAVSIVDGRLFRQATRLAGVDRIAVIIIERTATGMATLGVSRAAMQGALISVSVVFGIPVLRSNGPDETARLLVYAARQIRRVAVGGVQAHSNRPRSKRKRQLRLLQGLPGVGAERAARLLDKFGSVEQVMTACAPELMTVKGIGKRTAEAIRQILR